MIQIEIQSTNYNGQLADITFYPCSGGTISLGVQTIPYIYTNDNYQGTYDLFFSAFSQTCQLVITCLTPTPTITPTMTVTPTVTPTSTPSPNVFDVSNSGSGAYIINGQSNPTLTITEGETYTFNINAVGHPFWIKTVFGTGTANAYNDGVTNNGTENGVITFVVPYTAPSTLYYNCQYHISMGGTINVIDVPITPTPTPTTTTTPTVTPTPTITPTASPAPAFDPDAQAFFTAITTSGGTLNATEETAINNFVLDLKGYNIWNKFIGLYPVVSSGATTQSFNLKDPTQYNLDFNGTWAHTAGGAEPSGNGYAKTGIIPSVINFQASGSIHYSMYITENNGAGRYDMGSFNSGQDFGMLSSYSSNNTAYIGVGTGFLTTSNGGSTKHNWLMTNNGSTSFIYRDGVEIVSGAKTIGSGPTVDIAISANNNNGSYVDGGDRGWALASIGFGMDATEAANYDTAVVSYQTALSRQNI